MLNPLALAGRMLRFRTCTRNNRTLSGSVLPHEMSYSTGKTLQYGVTPAQESEAIVHTFRRLTQRASSKSASPQSYGIHVISRMYCVLTLIAVRIE
jgi:hypothetical protein